MSRNQSLIGKDCWLVERSMCWGIEIQDKLAGSTLAKLANLKFENKARLTLPSKTSSQQYGARMP